MKRHAALLATRHVLDPRPGADRLLPRLADNERVLDAACDVVTASLSPGLGKDAARRSEPAEAWLLDNYYLIEQQIHLARRHLPEGYSRELPRLADGAHTGFPRIYALAHDLISHQDGRVDRDNANQFLAVYQDTEPLRLGELWAFPIMLQLALLENLRRVAVRIAERCEERDAAIAWADHMLATAETDPKQLIRLLAEFAHADVPLTASFVEAFSERLQAPAMAFIQTWVTQTLIAQGVTATDLSDAASRRAATHQISIANSIGSLRVISSLDWQDFVEAQSGVEHALRDDPSGHYAGQDFATRDRSRHVVEDLARRSPASESDVARAAIALARAAADRYGVSDRRAHVGYFLLDEGRAELEQDICYRLPLASRVRRACVPYRLGLYLSAIFAVTALAIAGLAALAASLLPTTAFPTLLVALAAMPLLLAASALAVPLVNLWIPLLLAPRTLPRLDFSHGIPDAHRTVVIVPTLIAATAHVDELLEALEIRYLGNRDANVYFALLTDFYDAPTETQPDDAVLLAYAASAVDALNTRYCDDRPGIFYWLHRPRVWNAIERVWMGYERKRGKLEQFNARLRGEALAAFSQIVGDTARLPTIRYVITLDTDTQLPRDAARALVGNLAHPLNRPVFDAARGRITEGYAILQPRAAISLVSAGQSRFSRLFAGDSALDPYTREVSDVYQDVFGEGSFIGKGIYDIDAFRQAVDGRFPENLILSHDLLESGYARSALVSDVELIEAHPSSCAIDASRRHRWIRGDWQLAAWLLPRVPGATSKAGARRVWQKNPTSALTRWKLFDNLRRSLVAPALLALLLIGWFAARFYATAPALAALATAALLAVVGVPLLLALASELVRKPAERRVGDHLRLALGHARAPLAHAALTLAFLPYDARISLGAIARSALRMAFTRRGLLLWQLPSYACRNARVSLAGFTSEMRSAPLLALAVAAVLLALASPPAVWLAAAPLLLAWLAAPWIGWWISRPFGNPRAELSASQTVFLRLAARRTWRYFDDFVAPPDHWLPPDNYQEHPAPQLASRTSPTNIGMALLANLAAHDFGYLGTRECLQRSADTLTTLAALQRHRGHFYNWYDTRTLQPLLPHYVSTVDSGNLLGCLLTLQGGLLEFNAPAARQSADMALPARVVTGLQDTLSLLTAAVKTPEQDQSGSNQAGSNQYGVVSAGVTASLRALQSRLDTLAKDAPSVANATLALTRLTAEADALVAQLIVKPDPAILTETAYWARAFARQTRSLHADLTRSAADLVTQRERIDALVWQCRELARMDFDFLYDGSSCLLAIGYDVGERRRDPSCYDLLASEARLASFLLVAQGSLPQKHWFALGRLLTRQDGAVSLISWSGSMFEYLMPQLIMPSPPGTLLDATYKAVVARQIEYGRQRDVPWGISESGYALTDAHQVYQYRAFGVPGLGLKRGLGDDLVIAPYASALALLVDPDAACRNLQALADAGFNGDYGFYEAIDFTPARVPRGKVRAVVRSFMAHHQGMSLLAFAHTLLDQPMQRRFMADPAMKATERLLQERVPQHGAILHPHAAEVSAAARPPVTDYGATMRMFSEPDTPLPEVHLLSNGRYHVMATHAGGSTSRWRDLAITRWREDATCDNWGTFLYLRDSDTGVLWSAAHQPTCVRAEHYEAIFVQGRAEYRRRDQLIDTHTELCVSPEDDVEVRRVTLTNPSLRTRQIELTSYAEVVLAPHNADLAHRAFSNLFVTTELLPERNAILCTRRPRAPGEVVPWMFHLLAAPDLDAYERDTKGVGTHRVSFETDRARFIGRGRSVANPVVLDPDHNAPLSNTQGSVLDPIVAIRRALTLAPDQTATLQIVSGVADSREAALALLDKYGDRHFVDRAFEMAWFQSEEVLRHLGLTEADAQVFGRLANSVVFSSALRRADPGVLTRNRLGQSGLWRFGISGDLPIVLLHIGDLGRIERVKQVLQAHAYWRMKGLIADLVIVNEDFSGYRADLHDQIVGLIHASPGESLIDRPGGVFVRRAEELSEDERVLLQTVSRIVFSDTADPLIVQVERRLAGARRADALVTIAPAVREPRYPLATRERVFDNGTGGFTPDGSEYVITLEPGRQTPAPWVNVIASPHIGTVVSEAGSAYTWVDNAHEFRLTPWHNDPLTDVSGEAFYIRDDASGAYWSPTPLPAAGHTGYVCRHGFGYSIFEHYEAGIDSTLTTYVAMDTPVKFVVVSLRNASDKPRQLSLTGYFELVLGEARHANLMHIHTESDPVSGAIFARNAYGRECGGRLVFAHVSGVQPDDISVSGSRSEFIGRNGSLARPAVLRRTKLSNRTGAALDPCAALQRRIRLAPGQTEEIVFVLGTANNAKHARQLISQVGGEAGARQALEAVWEYWKHTLGAVQVQTPDPALDVLANGWLLYQTLSCRVWGRSGLYQSGGAYGFRDQLQDTMALVHAAPWLAREQLLRCAGRQFLQGDVQHWWHPPGGQGVRTQFSDDYLWLPYAACHYLQTTGDDAVLDEHVSFLEGRELNPGEEAYYDQPQRSAESASLYEHCVRALKHGLRFGAHQLPLMGCGDWNDGMNRVGHEGRGESVWLAWFLYDTLQQFATLANGHADTDFAAECRAHAATLRQNIEREAWDGNWYRRAWFDDGTPLGSASNDECRIDSISQSWSVISGGGDAVRARQAMAAVDQHLVRRDAQLIQLLDPPFDTGTLDPGYIKGYLPGVRENGGQYTHAAIWTTMAFALQGDTARAWELFDLINPVHHGSTTEAIARYKVEPYVMCADLYGASPHTGRGGWTWYTGAAGWMYRLGIETLLGVQREGDFLRLEPRVPAHWNAYTIHYRYRDTVYHIALQRRDDAAGQLRVDGVLMNNDRIRLVNDRREHFVEANLL